MIHLRKTYDELQKKSFKLITSRDDFAKIDSNYDLQQIPQMSQSLCKINNITAQLRIITLVTYQLRPPR